MRLSTLNQLMFTNSKTSKFLSMEVDKVDDSIEFGKNPRLLTAQDALRKLDILVCGECHAVFHFIEPFQEHQQKGKCTELSSVCEKYDEPKAQVWAFMLWKNSQFRKSVECEDEPWIIYQIWCKLNIKEKEPWVAAGQAIQSFRKFSTSAKVQEIRSKTAISAVNNKRTKSGLEKSVTNDKDLEEGEISLSQLTNAQRAASKAEVAANKSNCSSGTLAGAEQSIYIDSDSENPSENPKAGNATPMKTPFKAILQLNDDGTIGLKTSPNLTNALKTVKNDDPEETIVERILGRRYNRTNKSMEYFIKWKNRNETENSWEPKSHLEKYKALVRDFDKVFNKPKSVPKSPKHIDESNSEHSEVEEINERPKRASKQKALNQVKVWCGDITDSDEESDKTKSFSNDNDALASSPKKIKLDTSINEKPPETIKGVVKASNSLNGISKKSNKQSSSLPSGVYVLSKSEAIIIGQSHVDMMEKEPASTSNSIKTVVETHPGNTPIISTSKSPIKVTETSTKEKIDLEQQNIEDEDSDDGIEELEFPTDLPPPSPESPPREFTLCPLTGKVVGQSSQPIEQEEPRRQYTSLDILVQQAVAGLSDFDMDTSTHNLIPSVRDRMGETPMMGIETVLDESVNVPSVDPANVSISDVSNITAFGDANVAVTATSTPGLQTLIDILPPTVSVIKIPKKVEQNTVSMSNDIVVIQDDTEECPKPNTMKKINTKESLTECIKTRPTVGSPKKLLSTVPHRVHQKGTTVNHSLINRSTVSRPSPNKTLSKKDKSFVPKPTHQIPIVNKATNLTTVKPTNVPRRIGNTTIYKTSEKPQTSTKIAAPVISMPVLTTNVEPVEILDDIETLPTNTGLTDLPNFSLATSETPLLITGDDGAIYRVAGHNEEGQTILISEGPDGQQQCLLVSSDAINAEVSAVTMEDTAGEAKKRYQSVIVSTSSKELDTEGGGAADEEMQVVAQIIKADPPSPGGTRNVVLMLPDGNLMMTDVTAEEYAELELDK